MELPEEIERRLSVSNEILPTLKGSLRWSSSFLDFSEKCCVYITGSLARREADVNSDLDLFVVDSFAEDRNTHKLTYVEQARLISALEDVRRESLFKNKRFSGGGKYLYPMPFEAMIADIGDPSDDARNLFTARVTLLINSEPLFNSEAYEKLWSKVLDAYWLTGSGSTQSVRIPDDEPHMPIMLINDLRRWWLSVALNFERDHRHDLVARKIADRAEAGCEDLVTDPRVLRRIANLKLRYARMLAVFTVIIGMMAFATNGDTITRTEIEKVLRATPVERLVLVARLRPSYEDRIRAILQCYNDYLTAMAGPEVELCARFSNDEFYKPRKAASYDFHDKVYCLVRDLSSDGLLYRNCLI